MVKALHPKYHLQLKKQKMWDFSGGPLAKILLFHEGGQNPSLVWIPCAKPKSSHATVNIYNNKQKMLVGGDLWKVTRKSTVNKVRFCVDLRPYLLHWT